MGVVVFLSCWLSGMGCPALELAGRWVELGLSVVRDLWESTSQLILYGAERSLVVLHPVLGSPTSDALALHPARTPRPYQLHGREKEKTNEQTEPQRQMVKAKLNRQNHTNKHTHTLTKKRRRATKPINHHK